MSTCLFDAELDTPGRDTIEFNVRETESVAADCICDFIALDFRMLYRFVTWVKFLHLSR